MATTTQRIFMTGASGYVGAHLTKFAIDQGYTVHGLTRSETGAEKLRQLGATPIIGDLTSHDILRRESSKADIVINLATAYGIHSESYESVMHIDNGALDAIADGLEGSGKPLITTSGTLHAAADPHGGEVDETTPPDPNPINGRIKNEEYGLKLKDRGICVTVVRLSGFVYGLGGSGVSLFMSMAAKSGQAIVVDGGNAPVTYVHVDDAARLYLLVAQKGKAGEIFNAAGGNDTTIREMQTAIAETVKVPIKDISFEEAVPTFGVLAASLMTRGNRSTSAKAKRKLGWDTREVGFLEDIREGSYKKLAEDLLKSKNSVS